MRHATPAAAITEREYSELLLPPRCSWVVLTGALGRAAIILHDSNSCSGKPRKTLSESVEERRFRSFGQQSRFLARPVHS